MEYYLIDYENVNVSGLDGITRLSGEDVVVIFYSENADTMTFSLHRRLNESRAEVRFQRVEVGSRNALDFQLCTYLGYLIRDNQGRRAAYYVVSRDQGFGILTKYWKRQGVEVTLIPGLSDREATKAPEARNPAAVPKAVPRPRRPIRRNPPPNPTRGQRRQNPGAASAPKRPETPTRTASRNSWKLC